MAKMITGAAVALLATGLAIAAPNNFAVAQAPTESRSENNIALLSNPLYVEDAAADDIIEMTVIEEKIAVMKEIREERAQEEKERLARIAAKKKAKKEKKRLAAQKAKKRKQEIKACCGVAVGSSGCDILERIVEAEAGGEDFKGKLLVANVVLNRVKSDAFPSTIRAVVFEENQFSPISDGRYGTVTVSEQTKKAVKAALNGKDPSQGALYFMERSLAESDNVNWFDTALTRLFAHGCHEFYK